MKNYGEDKPVCKITFETWADALSGHNKFAQMQVELSGHCVKIKLLNSLYYGFKSTVFQ